MEKVQVSNVFIRRGLLLLVPEAFRVLGGQVQPLMEEEMKQRQSYSKRKLGYVFALYLLTLHSVSLECR